MTTEMMFVRFHETNDHEGEAWTWWLQLDDNAAELDKLAALLDACEEASPYADDFPFVLALRHVEPTAFVDRMVRYADDGYYRSHNKVVGIFTCPDDLGEQADVLYKGGIRDLFRPVGAGSPDGPAGGAA